MKTVTESDRVAEVKHAASVAAPQSDHLLCAAALLVIVFNPTMREHVRTTDPMLWRQVLDALGPLVGSESASIDCASL